MSKKIAAFIPLKLNNERLPGKNTKAFKGGKPLLTYILSSISECAGIDERYVYCSNDSVKSICPKTLNF